MTPPQPSLLCGTKMNEQEAKGLFFSFCFLWLLHFLLWELVEGKGGGASRCTGPSNNRQGHRIPPAPGLQEGELALRATKGEWALLAPELQEESELLQPWICGERAGSSGCEATGRASTSGLGILTLQKQSNFYFVHMLLIQSRSKSGGSDF